MIAHWDEVARDADLAQAAGAVAVSLLRFELAADEQVELPQRRTEDVLFVVAGGGDGLRAGDCVVYPAPHETATLHAGGEGLTALLFATPADPPPFHSGEPEPPRTINVADAESAYEGEAGRWVLLARQAGAQHAGVNFGRLEAGHDGAPPHCHSADEELFVFLEGGATFELWPSPLKCSSTRRSGNRSRSARATSSRGLLARASRMRSARVTRVCHFSSMAPGGPTTFAITHAVIRSTGEVLASSPGSNRSDMTTASPRTDASSGEPSPPRPRKAQRCPSIGSPGFSKTSRYRVAWGEHVASQAHAESASL